jgi:hypothetical protein
MITVQKQNKTNNPLTVIRAASGNELSNYEKNKLANIEENAQQNKLEAIKVNGKRVTVDPETKTADISLGNMAFKSAVTPDAVDSNTLFFIRCELD